MNKVTVEYDLTPAMVEGAIRDKLIEMGWTPPIPEKKIIDLSTMVGSGILMDFSDCGNYNLANHIDTLQEINNHSYIDSHDNANIACRILQDHWHHWNGDECPLPEGFEIEIEYYDRDDGELIREGLNNYRNMDWSNIAGFKVLATADGWIHEWQKEKKE